MTHTTGTHNPLQGGEGAEDRLSELLELANLYCEEQLSQDQAARLTQVLQGDSQLLAIFVEFLQIHAQLAWDVGHGVTAAAPETPAASAPATRPAPAFAAVTPTRSRPLTEGHGGRKHLRSAARSLILMFGLAAVLIGGWWLTRPDISIGNGASVAENGTESRPPVDGVDLARGADRTGAVSAPDLLDGANSDRAMTPLELDALKQQNRIASPHADSPQTDSPQNPDAALVAEDTAVIVPDDDGAIVERINTLLAKSWEDNGVQPSPRASDSEWVRRAYLTLTGAIPTADEAMRFVSAAGERNRGALITQLLDDSRMVDHLAVTWVNLLIGRSNPRDVDEDALFAFMRGQFEDNKPWIETVGELISAEGRSDENGATNFLLAHLNDQATPATAVTARLFFGEQVQCTQCHDHPFARDVHQDQFWALNAFFKQASRKVIPVSAPATNGESPGRNRRVWALEDSTEGGMTFYENRRGQQIAVLPAFAGERLSKDDGLNRRSELARLLMSDADRRVARAMVNRMWAHFFGAGFTVQIDDMGPHNPPSHPELLELLTTSFVKSGYDTRRLMRWIASSDAWQRTSARGATNTDDAPATGTTPLFSRVYSRLMVPEEVYDSIRIAIHSVSQQPVRSSIGTQHRRQWVRQFVESYGTDENDERLEFDGNISQALLMMNGVDIESAIPLAVQSLIAPSGDRRPSVSDCLKRVAVSVLSRSPTESEDRAFRNRYRALSRTVPADQALRTSLEDMLWAYLNSAEFSAVY